MKNKLISLVIIPLIAGLAGCASTPIVKEEKLLPPPKIEKKYVPPKNKEYNRAILAQSDFPIFCDCFRISSEIYKAYGDLAELKWIEDSSIEALQKNPNDFLEKIYLKSSLKLQKVVIYKKNELISEGTNCGCYEIEL